MSNRVPCPHKCGATYHLTDSKQYRLCLKQSRGKQKSIVHQHSNVIYILPDASQTVPSLLPAVDNELVFQLKKMLVSGKANPKLAMYTNESQRQAYWESAAADLNNQEVKSLSEAYKKRNRRKRNAPVLPRNQAALAEMRMRFEKMTLALSED